MPIFRTAQTSNFTILSNAIANDETLSGAATAALIYLITKPPHWQFNARDVKRRLGVGMNKVYRIMRELIQAGYATYQRIQSGTIWNIYDTKQGSETATAPESIDRVNSERVQNERVLEKTDLTERKKQQQAAVIAPISTTPMINIPVVVSDELKKEDLIYPSQVKEIKPLKALLKKIKPEIIAKTPAIKQEVLFELAYRMTLQQMRSVPAFLNTLITAVNNGTFTLTVAPGTTPSATTGKKQVDETQVLLAEYNSIPISSPSVSKAGIASLRSGLFNK